MGLRAPYPITFDKFIEGGSIIGLLAEPSMIFSLTDKGGANPPEFSVYLEQIRVFKASGSVFRSEYF